MTDRPDTAATRLRQLSHELHDAAPPPHPWEAVVRRASTRATARIDAGDPAAAPRSHRLVRWAAAGLALLGIAAVVVVAVRSGDRPPADAPLPSDVSMTTALATMPSAPPAEGEPVDWGPLASRTFESTGFDGLRWTTDAPLTIVFPGPDDVPGTVAVSGPCNGISLAGREDGGTLVVDDLVLTAMSCGPEIDAIEGRLIDLLRASPELRLVGDDLTIQGTVDDRVISISLRDQRAVAQAAEEGAALWASLVDRAFLAVAFDGMDWATDRPLRISFVGERVMADSACNGFGWPARIDGNVLVVSAREKTDVGCDPALMALDEVLSGIVGGRPTITLDGDELTLTGTSDGQVVTITLRDVRTPGLETPLVGVTWQLDLAATVDDPVGMPGTGVTLSFGADGALTIATPCGTLTAPFSAVANVTEPSGTLAVEAVTPVDPACADGAALAQRVVDTLAAATHYLIMDDQLRIQARADASLILTLVPDATGG